VRNQKDKVPYRSETLNLSSDDVTRPGKVPTIRAEPFYEPFIVRRNDEIIRCHRDPAVMLDVRRLVQNTNKFPYFGQDHVKTIAHEK